MSSDSKANYQQILTNQYETVAISWAGASGEKNFSLNHCNFVPDIVKVKGYLSNYLSGNDTEEIDPAYGSLYISSAVVSNDNMLGNNIFSVLSNVIPNTDVLCLVNSGNTLNDTSTYVNNSRRTLNGSWTVNAFNNTPNSSSGALVNPITLGVLVLRFEYIRFRDAK